MCRVPHTARANLGDIAASRYFSSELRSAIVNQTAMPRMNVYCPPANAAALFGAVVATLLCAMQVLADPPIAREEIRVVEKDIVQKAAQIDAETAKSVDALRAGGSVKEVHNGMNSAFEEWKTAARRLSLSPRETPLGTKLSLMHKDAALGGDAWKDAEVSLQSGWDGVVNDLGRDLETRKKAIEDAFELVNDAGQRVARPVAAREQLVNQTCNGFQASLDNATKKLASSYLDVIRKAVDGLDRGLKEQEEKHKAAEDAKAAAALAKQAADEAAKQKLLDEKQLQQQEKISRTLIPQWQGYEDLDEKLSRFCKDGDEPHDDGFDPPDERSAKFGIPSEGYERLRLFVLYGTLDAANKVINGDRFDKEDAAAALSEHREQIKRAKFSFPCKYVWHEGAETGPNSIRLLVDLPCRCVVPRSTKVGATDVFSGWWWWLDESTGSLKKCFNERDAVERRESGLQLYVPEDIYQTRLNVRVAASRDVLKLVARTPESCRMNVGISGLRVERPRRIGFFRLSVLDHSGESTDAIRSGFASGLNGPEGTPNYFVTQAAGENSEDSLPEVIVCDLERVEIVQATTDGRDVLFEWARQEEK